MQKRVKLSEKEQTGRKHKQSPLCSRRASRSSWWREESQLPIQVSLWQWPLASQQGAHLHRTSAGDPGGTGRIFFVNMSLIWHYSETELFCNSFNTVIHKILWCWLAEGLKSSSATLKYFSKKYILKAPRSFHCFHPLKREVGVSWSNSTISLKNPRHAKHFLASF